MARVLPNTKTAQRSATPARQQRQEPAAVRASTAPTRPSAQAQQPAQQQRRQAATPAPQQHRKPVSAEASAPLDSQWEDAAPVDAEDTSFGGGLIPEAIYTVTVDKAYFRQSKGSGKLYINTELRVIDGDYEGRFLFLPFYINSDSENFRKGQKGFLAKLFITATGAQPEMFPQVDEDLADLVGAEFDAKVIVEANDDGKGGSVEVNRVVRIDVQGAIDGGAQPLDDADDQAADPAPTRRQPVRTGRTAGPVDDLEDDIPF